MKNFREWRLNSKGIHCDEHTIKEFKKLKFLDFCVITRMLKKIGLQSIHEMQITKGKKWYNVIVKAFGYNHYVSIYKHGFLSLGKTTYTHFKDLS